MALALAVWAWAACPNAYSGCGRSERLCFDISADAPAGRGSCTLAGPGPSLFDADGLDGSESENRGPRLVVADVSTYYRPRAVEAVESAPFGLGFAARDVQLSLATYLLRGPPLSR